MPWYGCGDAPGEEFQTIEKSVTEGDLHCVPRGSVPLRVRVGIHRANLQTRGAVERNADEVGDGKSRATAGRDEPVS